MSLPRGKIPRDRKRRISAPVPYEKPAKSPSGMPTTRHSPARRAANSQQTPGTDPPMSEVLRELTLLRQSMETKFLESGAKVDNLKTEVLAKLDDNDQAIADLQETVTDITLSIDNNQQAIQEVRAEAERREVELPRRVKTIVQEALAASRAAPSRETRGARPRPIPGSARARSRSPTPTGDLSRGETRKEEAYARARRSLRVWPVSREGDLKERTVEYFINELLLDQQHTVGLDFDVKRVGAAKSKEASSKIIKDEVLVVFASVRDRDDIRSFAKNLERRGRGLRLELPDHLWPSFRVLQKIAYELKQRNAYLKRNILFDDDNADLKMDVCINSVWKTIYPDGARQALSKMGVNTGTSRATLGDAELEGPFSWQWHFQDGE